MHEFSICDGIVKAAVEEMRKAGATDGSLRSARVVVGRLHQVVPDNMNMAYEVLTRGTEAEGSGLELKFVPVVARCGDCGWEGEIEPPLFLCGNCGSGKIEVVSGRELYLDNLEIERHGD